MPRKATPVAPSLDNFVRQVAGENGLKVVKSLENGGGTDEMIEKETKLKIVEIRSVLNHLHNHGIVEYNREKNMTSGWFTYTWRLNIYRAMQNYLVLQKKECESLRTQTAGDGVTIYACPKGCAKMQFAKAMELGFACDSCKSKLKFADGTKELKELEKKISVLEQMVSSQTLTATGQRVVN